VRSHSCSADRTSSSSRLHIRDAVLELLSPFIHLCTTHTPVTVLNYHPTMNPYRFHAFAKQKSHNTSLLLLSALSQGHRHLVELFPRFLFVPQACQRHLLVAQGHLLCIPYTQLYRSYTRFLIQLFRFSTEQWNINKNDNNFITVQSPFKHFITQFLSLSNVFRPKSKSSSSTTNCVEYKNADIKIALSEFRSEFYCVFIMFQLQVWFCTDSS